MPIDRETLRQLEHAVRPLRTAIMNLGARGVVTLVDDTKKMQLLQLGVLAGETVPDAEHFQPFGFSSVPLPGDTGGIPEAFVVFPAGDRGHPIVVAVPDRRYRPTGGDPGTVNVYNHTGAKVTITKDGDILVRAAPGRDVFVDDGSGSTEPVVKRSEFLSHGHPIIATGAVSPCAGPVAGAAPAGSAVTFPGTDTLKVK